MEQGGSDGVRGGVGGVVDALARLHQRLLTISVLLDLGVGLVHGIDFVFIIDLDFLPCHLFRSMKNLQQFSISDIWLGDQVGGVESRVKLTLIIHPFRGHFIENYICVYSYTVYISIIYKLN